MEKVNRNVLETKADLRLADKIDELIKEVKKLRDMLSDVAALNMPIGS